MRETLSRIFTAVRESYAKGKTICVGALPDLVLDENFAPLALADPDQPRKCFKTLQCMIKAESRREQAV